MKKFLYLIVFIVAVTFAQKAEAAEKVAGHSASLVSQETVAEKSYANDVRVRALKNVLQKYDSILVAEAEHYVRSADTYGIDWRLLPAIAGLESSFGRHYMPGSYNVYGWGGGHIYFDSWADGIDTISKSLSERYYARGADTVWTIGPIYAESPTWAVRVNSFMAQIDSEYNRLTVLSVAPTF